MTRRLPKSLAEAASTFPGWTFPGTPDLIEATVQATSTLIYKTIASDRSLARSNTLRKKETRNTANDERQSTRYKRPVKTCESTTSDYVT